MNSTLAWRRQPEHETLPGGQSGHRGMSPVEESSTHSGPGRGHDLLVCARLQGTPGKGSPRVCQAAGHLCACITEIPVPFITPGLSLCMYHRDPCAVHNAWTFSLHCPLSCSDLQVHSGPVDGVLSGHPRKEPLSGHAVVPAVLPDVQGLLCHQDASAPTTSIAKLMTRAAAVLRRSHVRSES